MSFSLYLKFLALATLYSFFQCNLYSQSSSDAAFYVALENLETGDIIQRGSMDADGNFNGRLSIAPNSDYRYWLFEVDTGYLGFSEFSSLGVGQRTNIPGVRLGLPLSPDTDGDGLSDDGERIVGTDPLKADTNDDGINDWEALQLGLGTGALPTGVIGTTDTPGTALDVAAFDDLVVVADGSRGVSVFNVFNGMEPLIVAQVDTPGSGGAVALTENLVAVADGNQGLTVIDVSDPPAASITYTLPSAGSARAVAASGGIAYVGLDTGNLLLVELSTETILNQAMIGLSIEDVFIAGDYVYVLSVGRLSICSLAGNLISSVGSPGLRNSNNGRNRVFVGGGIAYATHNRGYNTIDVGNPEVPVLITHENTDQFGWKHIVLNGNGRGIAATSPNQAFDGPHHVSMYDVSNPQVVDDLLTTFETPGIARAVSIYNGFAYVADHTRGLQVVNYMDPDRLSSPPTIELTTSFQNNKAEEDRPFRITAEVTDDVQVRNVEFYVDGIKAATDGNYPFEFQFIAPRLVDQGSFTIQGRASDTGGNATWTDEIEIEVTPDATPPRATPSSQSLLTADGSVVVYWNEAINPDTINASNYRLLSAGEDDVLGTGDDFYVENGTVVHSNEINATTLSFPEDLEGGLYQAQVGADVEDVTGNSLGESLNWEFQVAREIVLGELLETSLSELGERDVYSFDAEAGDELSLFVRHAQGLDLKVLISDTFGEPLLEKTYLFTGFAELTIPETASYFIEIWDDGNNETGEYSLLVDLNSEGAPTIRYGELVTSAVDIVGDVDTYSFLGTAGDVIHASMVEVNSSTVRDVRMELYDSSGVLLASQSDGRLASIEFTLEATGDYYLMVRENGDSNTATYNLSLRRLNGFSNVQPIAYGELKNGSIDTLLDWDVYEFSGTAGDVIHASMVEVNSSTVRDVRMELYDSSGVLLASQSDGRLASIEFTLEATGDYYLMVRENGDSNTVTYNLSLRRLNGLSNVQPIAYGELKSGSIDTLLDWDVYEFSGTAGDVIHASMVEVNSSTVRDVRMELYDSSGVLLASQSDGRLASIEFTLEATGDYYLMVRENGDSNTVTYNLSLRRLNGFSNVQAIAYGELKSGSIDTLLDWDVYEFSGTAGDVIHASMVEVNSSTVRDVRMELYDSSGVLLASQSDGRLASIEFTLEATGDYYLMVRENGDSNTVTYNLSLRRLNGFSNVQPIAYGELKSGSIDTLLDWDVYEFSGTAGDVIHASMVEVNSSTVRDVRMELYDSSGVLLASQSDGRLASIEFTLEATGDYYLMVRENGDSNTVTYNLSLRRLNGFSNVQPIAYGELKSDSIDSLLSSDVYSFNAVAGDLLRVSMVHTNGLGEAKLELYDSLGTLVGEASGSPPETSGTASSLAELELTIQSDGTYYALLRERDNNETLDYNFTVRKLNGFSNVVPISYGELVSNSIDVLLDWDVYGFTAEVGDIIRVSMVHTSGLGEARVELYDSVGTLVGEATGSRPETSGTVSSLAEFEMTIESAGTYYAQLRERDNNETLNYNFAVRKLNGFAGVKLISYGELKSDSIDEQLEWDVYSFDAVVGEIVRVSMAHTSGLGESRVELYNSAGTLVGEATGSRPETSSTSSSLAEFEMTIESAGTYYAHLRERDNNETLNYNVAVRRLNGFTNVKPIAYGELKSDSIDIPLDWDVYAFTAEAGDLVQVTMTETSGSAELAVELFDSAGIQIQNQSHDSSVVFEYNLASAGTYYFLLRERDNNETFNYNLSLEKL